MYMLSAKLIFSSGINHVLYKFVSTFKGQQTNNKRLLNWYNILGNTIYREDNIHFRYSSNSMTGTCSRKLGRSKKVDHGILICSRSGDFQWYSRPQGGRTSTQGSSLFSSFTRLATLIYTSRRKLNPSPGLTSYSKYLNEK